MQVPSYHFWMVRGINSSENVVTVAALADPQHADGVSNSSPMR